MASRVTTWRSWMFTKDFFSLVNLHSGAIRTLWTIMPWCASILCFLNMFLIPLLHSSAIKIIVAFKMLPSCPFYRCVYLFRPFSHFFNFVIFDWFAEKGGWNSRTTPKNSTENRHCLKILWRRYAGKFFSTFTVYNKIRVMSYILYRFRFKIVIEYVVSIGVTLTCNILQQISDHCFATF